MQRRSDAQVFFTDDIDCKYLDDYIEKKKAENIEITYLDIFAAATVRMINIMGSPGAGKTSLITGLIGLLRGRWRIGVIEGDIAGTVDAERIAALGIPAVQLDTDGACHIEAMQMLPASGATRPPTSTLPTGE